MTEPSAKPDYRSTVFLPRTAFPMKAGLPQKEPGILARWQAAEGRESLYEQIRAARSGREKFILHDGPPYANGDIHVGHALNHVLKDMVVRTQTLLGRDAPYVPGWDCHGLPIEWKVEEEYRKKKRNKDEVPPDEFRAECRAYAAHWVNVQREQLKRLGIGGDWDHPYLTMDFASEAGIVAELMKFAETGQLYRGAKPVMWSPVEKTALAEAEIEYEDIVSTQIDVAFEIVESPIAELVGAYAVIWTTTPWTIPVNQAIAYGPEVEYAIVDCWVSISPDDNAEGSGLARVCKKAPWFFDRQRFLVASSLLQSFTARLSALVEDINDSDIRIERLSFVLDPAADENGKQIRNVLKGSELAGTIAEHPMANYFRHPGEGRGPASSADAGEGSGAPDQVRGDGGEDGAAPLPLAGGAGGGFSVGGDQERAHPNPSRKREGLNPNSPLAEFFLRPRPFLPGDFVTTDTGTGLVHMAPDHGEDDFALCKAHGIEPVFVVGADGRYRDDWAWLGGNPLSVINPKLNAPDGPICSALRDAGALLAAGEYRHSYPHSWRSKAKVIYRCTPQWFVPMDREIAPSVGFAATSFEGGGSEQHDPPPSGEGDHAQHGGGGTLRQRALAEIERVCFHPDKGRNRIGAMVAGRPDWVLSRQRAWGVPITLFVDRRSGQYLVDPAVNARIVAAIRAGGVDAWSDERAQEYLGNEYAAADYERVTDILDVWFDSGSTHAFVLESGRWPDLRWPADLYLEGSDQHRGWFQSSLLESCGTRGRAPYDAVLTHGFTMDAKGHKMSKSLGNTISPLKVMEQYGADIIRLWALSVDYTEDHRIGDEILLGIADQYRKLRNTFRYLLGALDGFDEAERVEPADMPQLERYVLALLARLDDALRTAALAYDFNSYVRALIDFCNEDLSAFYFDIRKDSLYCDAPTSAKRRACRTVLDTLFHTLVRYAAPVLVFTAEEVWGTRYPDGGSVHLLEWPVLPQVAADTVLWADLRALRDVVNEHIEPLRRSKQIGSGLEAAVTIWDKAVADHVSAADLAEVFISARVRRGEHGGVTVTRTSDHKCGRCWRHLPEVAEDGDLCDRCADVLATLEPAQ